MSTKKNPQHRGWACSILLLLIIISAPAGARGQFELIEQQVKASRLEGVVVLRGTKADPVSGAKIALHSCQAEPGGKWKMDDKVFATVTSDQKGHFAFAKSLKPKNACLKVDASGYNPMLLVIRFGAFSGALKIRLHVAEA